MLLVSLSRPLADNEKKFEQLKELSRQQVV